ncbi:MAG: hypothetical protein ACETV1_04860 [Candidatus Bathyarchaeia archaeon]
MKNPELGYIYVGSVFGSIFGFMINMLSAYVVEAQKGVQAWITVAVEVLVIIAAAIITFVIGVYYIQAPSKQPTVLTEIQSQNKENS